MNPVTIAIDPGRGGGLAVQYPDDRTVAWPMPPSDTDTLDLLRELVANARREQWPVRAFVEKVGGYIAGKGQPGSSMFNFGQSYGFLIGALMTLDVPLVLVRPQQWQTALQLGKSSSHTTKAAWKRHLRAEAARRYPHLKPTLSTADALLILAAALQMNFGRQAAAEWQSGNAPAYNEPTQTQHAHDTKRTVSIQMAQGG